MLRWSIWISKKPAFAVRLTRLSLKNGDGFVSCYQHSGYSCGIWLLWGWTTLMMYLEILVNRARWLPIWIRVVWMPRPVSVTNLFDLSRMLVLQNLRWTYPPIWWLLIRAFMVILVKPSKWFKKQGQGCPTVFACLGRIGPSRQKRQLHEKDAEGLGQILSQAHLHLKEIGVSSLRQILWLKRLWSQGALGAKMSGGGLGGCIIALVANLDQAQELAKRLEEKGAVQTWIESL